MKEGSPFPTSLATPCLLLPAIVGAGGGREALLALGVAFLCHNAGKSIRFFPGLLAYGRRSGPLAPGARASRPRVPAHPPERGENCIGPDAASILYTGLSVSLALVALAVGSAYLPPGFSPPALAVGAVLGIAGFALDDRLARGVDVRTTRDRVVSIVCLLLLLFLSDPWCPIGVPLFRNGPGLLLVLALLQRAFAGARVARG